MKHLLRQPTLVFLMLSCLVTCVLSGAFPLKKAHAAEPVPDWLELIRSSPYTESRGMAANLATIRRWVLFGESYCEEPERHLLFDRRWQFLGYLGDGSSTELITANLNDTRRDMAADGRVESWSPGTTASTGYPFALACDQPFTDMGTATARLTGSDATQRVWGTWDGMGIGTEAAPVSLLELLQQVVVFRHEQGRLSFPQSALAVFPGKIMIESGGQKNARSARDAIGILQLLPEVLDDCEIPLNFRTHRIAQVDCALRLMEQNHRNLLPVFTEVFGHLPESKRDHLYSLLLTQAYQIGVGRTLQLLTDEELGRASRFFAGQHEHFRAEDIMTGMVFHNLGRRDIGLMTLFYVTDIQLALDTLCMEDQVPESGLWCNF